MIKAHLIHADGRIELEVSQAVALEAPKDCTVWVDVLWKQAMDEDQDHRPNNGRDDHALDLLRSHWHFHPLAIEDAINRQLRAKYERYPTHDFLVLLALDQNTSESLDTVPICMFLRQKLLVTVRHGSIRAVDTVLQRLKTDTRGTNSMDRLVHLMVDSVVDEFMPLLDRHEDRLDELELRSNRDIRPQVMEDLVTIRRELLHVRRILTPFQELVRRYIDREGSDVASECHLLFRDVTDHILVLQDLVAVRLEICNGAIQAHANASTERLNVVMKYLAVVSTLGLPMTVISGVFGMNFDVIPIAHHNFGFFIAVGLMFFSAGLLMGWFRYKRWL
ncbi:MAG TPA: magnesium transporter CorA family protein [Myxococcota bacterium]|nr:magnesium transporter CorA family protein [Myxococcota bacterium]HND30262.1 magnesium transporter CorA family protein [Myxococcota bacterium]